MIMLFYAFGGVNEAVSGRKGSVCLFNAACSFEFVVAFCTVCTNITVLLFLLLKLKCFNNNVILKCSQQKVNTNSLLAQLTLHLTPLKNVRHTLCIFDFSFLIALELEFLSNNFGFTWSIQPNSYDFLKLNDWLIIRRVFIKKGIY